MSKRGYYKTVLYPGGAKLYACVVCGELHVYATGAKDCCESKKPAYALDTAFEVAESSAPLHPHLPVARLKKKHGKKDKWGHWRRSRQHVDLFDDYRRTMARIEKAGNNAQLGRLDKLWNVDFESWYKELFGGKHTRTPLQNIAWGFLNHNWDQVRAAAIELAQAYAEAAVKDALKGRVTKEGIL